MGRQIISKKDVVGTLNGKLDGVMMAGQGTVNILSTPTESLPAQVDDYASKLVKYIPAEVVALYIALNSILVSSDKTGTMLYWIVFLVCLVGTGLYLWKVAKVTKILQISISVVAFFVWAFALGGPFEYLDWYEPLYGALLLPIYTFFIPMFEP
ncbi:hypothetical protein [Zooshikella sp. RANM57]|uniref:hypothetical protein n=1 Tax=Zooshikella sp. RANM57 TaxID=3425863 RepID=UPI003D700F7F